MNRTDQTFATLEDERAWLIESIQGIEAQLSQGRTDMRDDDPDFVAWRRRALDAKRHLIRRLADVKEAIKEHNVAESSITYARRFHLLRRAVLDHRQQTIDDEYEPTKNDLVLWGYADQTFRDGDL